MYTANNDSTTHEGLTRSSFSLQKTPSPPEGQPQAKELDEDTELPQPREGDWQDDQHEASGRG